MTAPRDFASDHILTSNEATFRLHHTAIAGTRLFCIGVTSDLALRAHERREGLLPGFTSHYGCKLLVWYERFERMDETIACEKQIKGASRKMKLALIEKFNLDWKDL